MSIVRMWRGWRVIVPVIVVNALVQALLMWPPFAYDAMWWFWLSAVLSAVALGGSFALVAATALRVEDGPVHWAAAVAPVRRHVIGYTLWAATWLITVSIGLALYTLPGLVVAALTPYLLIAALDGHRNALGRNLRTIGRRPWRWLLTTALVGLGLLVGVVASGLFTFFVRPPLAAFVVWLIGGLLVAWLTVVWARIYRDAWDVKEANKPAEDVTATPREAVGG
jgi:hypothetical protein